MANAQCLVRFCLPIIVAFIAFSAIKIYTRKTNSSLKESIKDVEAREVRILNDNDIKKGLLIVILGHVFDVASGSKFYGKSGGYSSFVGRGDSTHLFISGPDDGQNDISKSEKSFTGPECKALINWLQFYKEHKTYKYVGLHHGKYFNGNGSPTETFVNMEKCAENEIYRNKQEKDNGIDSCNTKWSIDEGSVLWCSPDKVPRRAYDVDTSRSDSDSSRCVCFPKECALKDNVDDFFVNPDNCKVVSSGTFIRIERYENCEVNSSMCNIR